MLHKLKNSIKNNLITQSYYNKIQSLFILFQYKFIVWYYGRKKEFVIDKVKTKNNGKKVNIFYFGGDELQDKSGFLQALTKFSNLSFFTKEDGSYGSYNYGILNRKLNIEKNRSRLLFLLNDMTPVPDILLMQTWEWRIGLNTLKDIKKIYPKIVIVNIGMDDRHSFWIYGNKKIGSAGLIPALDAVFSTSSEAVQWYKKEGCNAFFYPLASDPSILMPINTPKLYDVGFVGAKYGIREIIVKKLLDNGINVKAYGNGWESGRLPLEDTNEFYNQCRIVLGVGTILGSKNFTSMKLRDFDVPMSGSVYLTNYNEDTAAIFEDGKEIFFYRNADECVSLVESLLSNEIMLNEIRKMTLKKALDNTYSHRVQELLNRIWDI